MAWKFNSIPPKKLAETISASDTTFSLNDILGYDGVALSASIVGDTMYGSFQNAAGTIVEFFKVDTSTIASSTITMSKRGLSFNEDGTEAEVSANKLTWVKGVTIVQLGANPPALYAALRDYIDDVAISGAPNASNIVKGIVEVGTQAEIDADTATGATGAALTITPDQLVLSKYGTRLPSAGEKQALAGSTGTPGTSNKFITQDNTSSAGNAETQTTSTNTIETGEADATTKKNKLAQKFTATKTSYRGVTLNKKADTGTFSGTVTVALYANSGGSPTGSALATATITNANWLLIPTGDFDVIFASEYSSATVGTDYHIQISTSTSDNSNHPNLGGRTSGGTGTLKYNNTTDGWVAIASADIYYKTIEGTVTEIVKTGSDGLVAQPMTRYAFLDLSNTNTTVNNSTTETTAYTKLLSGVLGTSSGIKLTLVGTYGVGGVTVDGTNSVRVKLNGTTVVTLSLDASAMDQAGSYHAEVYIINDNSTSSQKTFYKMINGRTVTANTGDASVAFQLGIYNAYSTSAVTTTGSDVVTVTLQNSDAGTDDECSLQTVILEKIA